MSVITIIGAGMMGSALSIPACDNGHEVRIVGTHLDREIIEHMRSEGRHIKMDRPLPDGISCFQIEELEKALPGTDLVIGGVSSMGVDWFAEQVLPRIPDSMPILSVTKGLICGEDGTLIPFPHYMQSMYPDRRLTLCAIGGPCTSYELADRSHSAVAFCGGDMQALKWMRSLLETDYYHVSVSTDVVGVECAVAMKNAYALGVSLAVGLAEKRRGEGCILEYNPQAALFLQSTREMRRLLRIIGGREDSIVYGVGDLYVTIFGGRTRRIGTLLGRGLTIDEALSELKGVTLESLVIARRTIKALHLMAARGIADEADFPLLMHIDQIISGKPVDIPWKQFEE